MEGTMKVYFVNAQGQGYSEELELPVGTTIATLFAQKMGSTSAPAGFTTIVRRGTQAFGGAATEDAQQFPLTPDFVLEANDRVSILPSKMRGA